MDDRRCACGDVLPPYSGVGRRPSKCRDCRTTPLRKPKGYREPETYEPVSAAVLSDEFQRPIGPIEAANFIRLQRMGIEKEADAEIILALSRRLDKGGESGSAFAATARELRAMSKDVFGGTGSQPDFIDELMERRAAKAAGQ
jgi:hypothetical protein